MDEENNGMDWAWLLMVMALFQSQIQPEQELPKDSFYCVQPMNSQNINRVEFDDFSIDQLRKATMNRKEAEETRLDMLREAYEKGLDDYNGFTGFYNFGKDDDS